MCRDRRRRPSRAKRRGPDGGGALDAQCLHAQRPGDRGTMIGRRRAAVERVDDDGIAEPLVVGLRREGFEVTRVANGTDALILDLAEVSQRDLALVGGKGGPNKELVLAAAEKGGRVRLAHAANNDAQTCKRFADGEVAARAAVTTDGHAGYNEKSLGERDHAAVVQTKAEKREADCVQTCHWAISQLKRWLMGTHACAVGRKHLQAYLDEFVFRHNRRNTNGIARIAARVIESAVAKPPLTRRSLVKATVPYRRFASAQALPA